MKVVGSLVHDCDSGLNKPEVGNGDLIVGSEVVRVHIKSEGVIVQLIRCDDGWWSVYDYLIVENEYNEEEYTTDHLNSFDELHDKYGGR